MVGVFFPETQDRSLEDMDAIFITAKGPLDVPKVTKRQPQLSILALGQNEATEKVKAPAWPDSAESVPMESF